MRSLFMGLYVVGAIGALGTFGWIVASTLAEGGRIQDWFVMAAFALVHVVASIAIGECDRADWRRTRARVAARVAREAREGITRH